MKSRLFYIILASLIGLCPVSCISNDSTLDETEDMSYIELTLASDTPSTRNKTGETSDLTEAEKKIKTADIFFYINGASENTPAVYHHHIDNTAIDVTHKIVLSEEIKKALFPDDATTACRAYTVVNVSDFGNVDKSSATIAQLRAIRVSTPSFAKTFDGMAMFTEATNGDVVTYYKTERKASGTLKVKNLAAKIDLFVNFGEIQNAVDPTDPDNSKNWSVWNSATKDGKDGTVKVYLVNGTTVVPLNGWSVADYNNGEVSKFIAGEEYFDLRAENGKYSRHIDDRYPNAELPEGEYRYVIKSSLYSYPNQWTNDVFEQHQTYLMMKVNWMPDDIDGDEPVETDLIETYYKIPINLSGDSENKLLSNRYYRVKVNINTLGGINFGTPVDLTDCSWEVLPWGDSQINADIHEIRWLEVEQEQEVYNEETNEFDTYTAVMNNTTSVTIPYNSTHKVYLHSVKIHYYNFNTSSSSSFVPQEVNVLAYRLDRKGTLHGITHIDDGSGNYSIDPTVFTLTDDKIQWFKDRDQEVNGLYIDHENQCITFYHSVYPLIGDAANGVYTIYDKDGTKVDKTYSPYYIELVLAHEDTKNLGSGLYKSDPIKIIQYPGVYVTFTKNTGRNADGTSIGRKVPNGAGTASSIRYGVLVNGGGTGSFQGFNEDDQANSLQLGGIGGNGRSNNQNMYAIHVTQLSEDDFENFSYKLGKNDDPKDLTARFHIGDPRTKNVNNNLAGDDDLTDTENTSLWGYSSYYTNNFLKTTSLDSRSNFRKVPATSQQGGAQRLYHKEESTLRYYYPTAEGTNEEQVFRLAPVFRLASGNSDLYVGSYLGDKSSDRLSRESARRRCAALQDNGYPAGRWRVPTLGEFLFFRVLQKRGVLPNEIFKNDRAHWTAQALMKFDEYNVDIAIYKPNDGMDHKWVRCVYDDWYWVKDDGSADIITAKDDRIDVKGGYASYYGDTDKRTMFVWGDKLKDNPLDQPQN